MPFPRVLICQWQIERESRKFMSKKKIAIRSLVVLAAIFLLYSFIIILNYNADWRKQVSWASPKEKCTEFRCNPAEKDKRSIFLRYKVLIFKLIDRYAY